MDGVTRIDMRGSLQGTCDSQDSGQGFAARRNISVTDSIALSPLVRTLL